MKRSLRNQVEPRRRGGISAVHGCRRAASVPCPGCCLRSRARLRGHCRGVGLRLGTLGEYPVDGEPDWIPLQGGSESNEASAGSSALSAARRGRPLGGTSPGGSVV